MRKTLADAELSLSDQDPSLVRLGDASIASPFTSKRATIECVLAIVCQGRCTLVSMIQIFKILAVLCLVSAYMLSSLYLHGVKQGDAQMTVISTQARYFDGGVVLLDVASESPRDAVEETAAARCV